MRDNRVAILFVEPSGDWRISSRRPDGAIRTEKIAVAGATASIAAKKAAENLAALGNARKVVVALPAEFCICATVDRKRAAHPSDRTSLLFALEESLPMAAEDVRADFVFRENKAFGVCAIRSWVDPILTALESERINVIAVCPAALLALQGYAKAEAGGLHDDVILLQDGNTTHLFAFEKAKLAGWFTMPSHCPDLSMAIVSQVLARQAAVGVAMVNADESIAEHVAGIPDVAVTGRLDRPLLEMQESAAEKMSGIRMAPMLDLSDRSRRVGSLFASRAALPSAAARAACAMLCIGVSTSFLCRAQRYANLTAGAQAEKEEIFRRVFPGQPIPLGIVSRLESMVGQLKSQAPTDAIDSPDALAALHEVLTHLPQDVRYNISEMDVEPGRMTLQGLVRSHEDADAVAVGLRRSPRIRVEDPQTQQVGSTSVQFTISGPLSVAKGNGGKQP